jgi:hypothetical protein
VGEIGHAAEEIRKHTEFRPASGELGQLVELAQVTLREDVNSFRIVQEDLAVTNAVTVVLEDAEDRISRQSVACHRDECYASSSNGQKG